MIRTYVDTGVLIAAARGEAAVAFKALDILDDPNREFASSMFVKLEVFPKALYNRNETESEFYETFFSRVMSWADSFDAIVHGAFKEACDSGLAALDALHVVSAVHADAEELVTTERLDKPIHRTRLIRVVSIAPV